jgi:transposase
LQGATTSLAFIGLLYKIERRAHDIGRAERYAPRQSFAVPALEHFKEYLERERLRVLPKSPEGMALTYALSNWAALHRYTEDGDLPTGRVEMWCGCVGSAYLFPALSSAGASLA